MPSENEAVVDAESELEAMTGTPESTPAVTPEAEEPAAVEAEAEPEPTAEEPVAEPAESEEKGLSETEQAGVNKRIGKLLAERDAALAKAAEAEAKASAKDADLVERLQLNPDWIGMPKADAEFIAATNKLEADRAYLLQNLGGIESDDPAKAMTSAQVGAELARVDALWTRNLPRANRLYDEGKARMLALIEKGRKQEAHEAALAAAAKAKPKTQAEPKTPGKVLPLKAVAQPTRRPMVRGQDEDRFFKAGGDGRAAERELAELAG